MLFSPYGGCYLRLVNFLSLVIPYGLQSMEKMQRMSPFAQNKGHDMNLQQNITIAGWCCAVAPYIEKKEVNISTVVALNSSLVQTHLRFRYLGAYSK